MMRRETGIQLNHLYELAHPNTYNSHDALWHNPNTPHLLPSYLNCPHYKTTVTVLKVQASRCQPISHRVMEVNLTLNNVSRLWCWQRCRHVSSLCHSLVMYLCGWVRVLRKWMWAPWWSPSNSSGPFNTGGSICVALLNSSLSVSLFQMMSSAVWTV